MSAGKDMAQTAVRNIKAAAAGIADAVRPRRKSKADLPPPRWDSYTVLTDMGFGDMLEKRTRMKDEADFRLEKIKEIDVEIQALMMIAGTEKVTWEDRPVTIVHSSSGSKIVAEKLLMAGVPAQTIADATEPGTEYQYVLVGKVKSKE